MTPPSSTHMFVFDTTHHAMWAEDVAREQTIPVEVVPAPADGGGRCGVALQVPPEHADELTEALKKEGILYRILDVNPP